MASRAPDRVADIAAERFERIAAERATLLARLADNERRLKAFCQRYSDAHGYRMRLNADQVRLAMGR